VNIGLDAIAMIDSGGSIIDAITSELTELSDQKIFEFTKPISLQLGCKGSCSKVSFGAEGHLQYGPINHDHYWDVANLNKYNAIISIPVMRKFTIAIDPASNCIIIGNTVLQPLQHFWKSLSCAKKKKTK
jgi:hypothetical protein